MATFNRTTEQESLYDDLEKMSTLELLKNINNEDQKVAHAIKKKIPEISSLIDALYKNMATGGRVFYIGAGTSGRLGIVDASECPPTFGVPPDMIIGIMAGGDIAIRKSVEFAEDDVNLAWKDLAEYFPDSNDFVIGIAASGTTPYVIHGLADCKKNGISTGCITCNEGSPLAKEADYPIEVIVGPEFVTGSTRMKSGTAQKLVLNMISTSIMIKLGRVQGNRMVDMQLSNNKLLDRGIKMVQNALKITYSEAGDLLKKHGNVRAAINGTV
ncbi:MAG: N-acetylmuramic acid 6-phosphate etherase [Saprospiraceae bacterium]